MGIMFLILGNAGFISLTVLFSPEFRVLKGLGVVHFEGNPLVLMEKVRR